MEGGAGVWVGGADGAAGPVLTPLPLLPVGTEGGTGAAVEVEVEGSGSDPKGEEE